MRKIVIAIFLFINISDAKNEFIKICENPTSSQFHTLDSIIKKYDGEDKIFEKKDCKNIEAFLKKQKYIILMGRNITDLTPFQYFNNLNDLSLDRNNISDLTPLSKLSNIKELQLYDNPITDLTPLSNLIKIEKLNIYNKELQDISPLKNLTNLK